MAIPRKPLPKITQAKGPEKKITGDFTLDQEIRRIHRDRRRKETIKRRKEMKKQQPEGFMYNK